MTKREETVGPRVGAPQCDELKVIDLRGAARLQQALLETAYKAQPVSSTRQVLIAYGVDGIAKKYGTPDVNRFHDSEKAQHHNERLVQSEAAIKKIRLSVLKALQHQSNAGFVSLRDVSSVIDDLLRKQ